MKNKKSPYKRSNFKAVSTLYGRPIMRDLCTKDMTDKKIRKITLIFLLSYSHAKVSMINN